MGHPGEQPASPLGQTLARQVRYVDTRCASALAARHPPTAPPTGPGGSRLYEFTVSGLWPRSADREGLRRWSPRTFPARADRAVRTQGQAVCCRLFFQAEDGIRDWSVTGVQTCALPI